MQRDVVLRWIQQLSAIIARLLRRDPTVSLDLARQYLEDAEAQTLGPLAPLVDRLDAASAASLLDDANRLFGYSQILALRSALARAEGRATEAETLGARAIAIGQHAVDRADEPQPEWRSWLNQAAIDLRGSPRATEETS